MRWPQDADGWPLREHSRLVLHRPHRWHVQEVGTGDTVLLIHGAGGATQSWRHLFPILARTHRVVAVDLTHQQGWKPKAIIGHSAGVAIALRMAELGAKPNVIIGINAALGNFKGVAGWLFPAMAKVLAITPFSASLFAATTTRGSVRNLLLGTGSQIGSEGEDYYYRLAKDKGHVDATLSMMAQWSLDDLLARLDRINLPVHLITGVNDKAVPPSTSEVAVRKLGNGQLYALDQFGHLAHEENAPEIAKVIKGILT